jgi:hypothetical protein
MRHGQQDVQQSLHVLGVPHIRGLQASGQGVADDAARVVVFSALLGSIELRCALHFFWPLPL